MMSSFLKHINKNVLFYVLYSHFVMSEESKTYSEIDLESFDPDLETNKQNMKKTKNIYTALS